MRENIHFNDNIFYLAQMVRLLDHSFKLQIDYDLFSQRLIDDILFIDKSVQIIYSGLKENKNLIKRNDYLHALLRVKHRFISVLTQYLEQDPEEQPDAQTFSPQIRRARDNHEKDIIDIRAILKDRFDTMAGKDVLSYDELNYLMTPVEMDDEDTGKTEDGDK